MTSLSITSARLLDRPGLQDVKLQDGLISAITPSAPAPAGGGLSGAAGPAPGEHVDAGGGLLIPGFVECHFHPDKALTRDRVGPVTSTSLEANMAAGAAVKAGFTRADIISRASRALDLGIANGITTLRAQVDVDGVIGLTGLEAILEVRERLADALSLQIVAFPQQGIVRDPGVEDLLRRALELGADFIGGGPTNERTDAEGVRHLHRIFALAAETGTAIDIHIDMAEDPEQRFLELLARLTIEHGMHGRVTATHCCALAVYPEDVAAATIELVREAGIQICICPIGNLLIASDDDEPHGRGASRPKALLRAGVNVAAGSDNLNDMWFRYGRLDPAEVAMISALSIGMRTDAEVREALSMVTTRAARFAGVPDAGVVVGAPADLVLCSAQNIDDLLRGGPGTRRTFKAGRPVGGTETRIWRA